MHEYPPWHPDWEWGDFGSLFCPLIFPAIGLLFAAVVIIRSTTGAKRLKLLAIAIAVAFCWPLLPWPVVANARTAARRTICRNNLKWIAVAVHKYHDEHGRLPSPLASADGGPPVSWRTQLLQLVPRDTGPSLGNSYNPDLAADYDPSRAWDDEENLPIALQAPLIYECPANPIPQDPQQRWYTAYSFLTGPGTAFPADGPLTLGQITDGTSNTLLIVEACGQNIVWTEPRDVDTSRDALQINAPGNRPGTSAGIGSSYHDSGAQMALADGSVRFLSEKISPDVLQKLTTAAGRESLTDTEF